MKHPLYLIVAGLAAVLLAAANAAAKTPLQVHVSILPQKYFVERIAEDLAVVDVLVKPGKSPATYSPTPAQVKALSKADVYFRIGVPFENGFLHKIRDIARNTEVVDTRKGIRLRDMGAHVHEEDHHGEKDRDKDADHHGETDHHGEEKGHGQDHQGKDPHIWMSPVLVRQQADTILETLVRLDPAHADRYKENHKGFAKDLEDLNNRLTQVLAPIKGQNIFVFHPAFGYFTDAYGLRQIPVETMGKAPKGKDLSAIIKLAKKEEAKVIFVQPQFDRTAAQKIAGAIKGSVVSINPLAYDYMANMTAMAETVANTLKP